MVNYYKSSQGPRSSRCRRVATTSRMGKKTERGLFFPKLGFRPLQKKGMFTKATWSIEVPTISGETET